ncbi:MAG: L,D-transpeptidase [Verrucomicrobiota bacterium]
MFDHPPPARSYKLPPAFFHACRRHGVRLTRFVLIATARTQRMELAECDASFRGLASQNLHSMGIDWRRVGPPHPGPLPKERENRLPRPDETTSPSRSLRYTLRRRYLISTSKFGIGQVMGSNQTPLGLHRVAEKIGDGQLIGTVFRSRQPIGLTWQGMPNATIAHRILWLEGLEPGFNRGGNVDTHARYIYIHGLGDEPTLGRPASHGCIHLSAQDLIPLFDFLPSGTLVWIQK